jgi:hypothetical protein
VSPTGGVTPPAAGPKAEIAPPADPPAVTPVTPERAPTTSYDVDIYYPKAGDTYDTVSREFYGDGRYAAALKAYNRNKEVRGTVDVPPVHVVRKYAQPQPGAATPAGRAAANAEWGAARTFRVPEGGMSMRGVAREVFGTDQRWQEIYDLNPQHRPNAVPAGAVLRLPTDARGQ